MTASTPPPRRRWRDATWRGPSSRWLALTSLLIILALAGLLAAALFGFSRGLADRQASAEAQISQRLAAGIEQMQAGNAELAVAEFQRVLQLDLGNAEASSYLQSLQANV